MEVFKKDRKGQTKGRFFVGGHIDKETHDTLILLGLAKGSTKALLLRELLKKSLEGVDGELEVVNSLLQKDVDLEDPTIRKLVVHDLTEAGVEEGQIVSILERHYDEKTKRADG